MIRPVQLTRSLGVSLAIAAGLMVSAPGLIADPIKDRQSIMKSIGKTLKGLTAMANGEVEFDANMAKTGLGQIESFTADLPGLFPEGSISEESEAAPAIWEKRGEFDAALDAFIASATNASYPQDSFELGDRLGELGKNCKSCHQSFRIKKD